MHGLCFEYVSGKLTGCFLNNDGLEVPDLKDDELLRKRQARWQDVEPGERIVEVSGDHNNFGYLAASIALKTDRGSATECEGVKRNKYV